MPTFRPKYITFDCHGTLIHFQMAEAAQDLYGDQLDEARMAEFIRNFSAYRLDEVMKHWQPYATVVHNALERTCKRNGVAFKPEDARAIYDRVPSWGPHPDVPEGLARVAEEFPLVTLTNSMEAQIGSNAAKLGAPFHVVYTAEQAGAYKPHFQAFEIHLRGMPAAGRRAMALSVVNAMRDDGVLVSTTGADEDALKVRPPLVCREDHVDRFLEAFEAALTRVR